MPGRLADGGPLVGGQIADGAEDLAQPAATAGVEHPQLLEELGIIGRLDGGDGLTAKGLDFV